MLLVSLCSALLKAPKPVEPINCPDCKMVIKTTGEDKIRMRMKIAQDVVPCDPTRQY